MFFKINIANIFELFIIIYEKQRQINEFIFVVRRLPRLELCSSLAMTVRGFQAT